MPVVQEGLRTLCVAYRRLSHSEYEEACHHLTEAKLALQDREQRLAQAYDVIEREFVLLGATAVEDRWVRAQKKQRIKSINPAADRLMGISELSSRGFGSQASG